MTATPSDSFPDAQDIPNRFDHAEVCTKTYQTWEEAGCFHAEPGTGRPPYTIVIPPPNVTGALHLGHGLNNTLQDVLIRMHRMRGYEALWMPGTDHAGIATQAVVERRLQEDENKTRHDLGREALIERIWAWKDQYEGRILGQLKRMGCSCDWRRTRFTLDDRCAAAVRVTFFSLFAEQLIYRGKRLVNWDTFLQTAVSDDEVFNETVKGHFWHFSYKVIDPKPGEPSSVEIATTRPETMLGDTAVAVHPDPKGALERVEKELRERLASAPAKDRAGIEAQLEGITKRRTELLPQLELLSRMAAEGRQLMLPLVDRPIPLIADEWAKPELGSGCVKITPAHDPNDYEVGKRGDLPMINILNSDGTLNEAAGKYEGLNIKQARKAVVADLDALGLLGDIEDREIELPYSDRSKTPIEPYLADQWFVKMDTLAQSAMDAVTDDEVSIFPHRYEKGYLDWLSEKRDWPVSRQLWWGHRIPIWSISGMNAEEVAAKKIAVKSAAGDKADDVSMHHDEEHLFVCLRNEDAELEAAMAELGFVQDPDVLDTWFSSALWPHSTLGWPEKTPELEAFYPTNTLITSRDIISLWVARMVLMSKHNLQTIPFREVYIHPTILDGNGERMSKSKGNGVDPIDVIDKFGPDALRFGLARLATETQDVRLPVQYECPHCERLIDQTKKNRSLAKIECPECKKEFATQWAESAEDLKIPRGAVVSERFENARNFANKLWNASRFVMMNMEGFEATTLKQDELNVEDRWLLSRLSTVNQAVNESLKTYQFAEAARSLYDFAWDDFCSFYVEIAKPRLADPAERSKVQNVLAHALDQLMRLLHPLMPFVTESIWGHLNEIAPKRGIKESEVAVPLVMRAVWPEPAMSDQDPAIEQQFARFQAVLGALREIRSRQNIPPKEKVPFSVRCDAATVELLQPMTEYFAALAGADAVQFGDVEPFETGVQVSVAAHDLEVFIDLEKFIDVEAELVRLDKLQERLGKQIQGKNAKLSNENFVSRAPADIVAQERSSLEEMESQLVDTKQAIERLKAKLN
ncbi:Valine--tRNA ligase [Roseimaritima multifibrata]|uniref:Valine--tRNA ligase n=1 Tax=Roseimaritima multifibrata TaxID=1930274 RepID=A0A517MBP2_9BACT|nr:valine--tRNA ligase [Roseimaritima multifibrata]QDS92285.1 Valine--tRNA ligase [Roseimaritima multifibrata]